MLVFVARLCQHGSTRYSALLQDRLQRPWISSGSNSKKMQPSESSSPKVSTHLFFPNSIFPVGHIVGGEILTTVGEGTVRINTELLVGDVASILRAPALWDTSVVAKLLPPGERHELDLPDLYEFYGPDAGRELDPALWDLGQLSGLGPLQEDGGLRAYLYKAMESMERALKDARDPDEWLRSAPWEPENVEAINAALAQTEDWRDVHWLFSRKGLPLIRCWDCGMPKGLRGQLVKLPHCETVRTLIRWGGLSAGVKSCSPFIFNICPACYATFESIGALLRHLARWHHDWSERPNLRLLHGGAITKPGFDRFLAVFAGTDMDELDIPPGYPFAPPTGRDRAGPERAWPFDAMHLLHRFTPLIIQYGIPRFSTTAVDGWPTKGQFSLVYTPG